MPELKTVKYVFSRPCADRMSSVAAMEAVGQRLTNVALP